MSKELVKKIVRSMNTVPVGIKFNFDPKEKKEGLILSEPMNYCETVYKAMRTGRTFILDGSSISCQAAREVFGIEDEKLLSLKKHFNKILNNIISQEEGNTLSSSEILKLRNKPNSIAIGALVPNPDVYILFLNSNSCDRIVKAYTRLYYNKDIGVVIDASNIMPICYNCTVRPFLKGNISISWDAGENENCNEFIKNSMVVGIPGDKIEEFINHIEEEKEKSLQRSEV